MQILWSKILAGEANSPGKFSKRTVNFVSGLDKNEAELFKNFCGFVWRIQGLYIPLVYDVHTLENHAMYGNDMIFGGFNHLKSIGLIHYESVQFRNTAPAEMSAEYFGRRVKLKLVSRETLFDNGSAILTRIGKELAPICESEPVNGFFEFVTQKWKQMGYTILRVDSE